MRSSTLCGFFCAALLASSTASAGVYSDDLGKCLVKYTSPQDRVDLVVWMFAAISLNPSVQSYTSFPEAKRDEVNHKFTTLLMRLLSADCRSETVTALKFEGAAVLESSFALLGEVAGRGLMNDPHVAPAMQSLGSDIDKPELNRLFEEAGAQH